MSLSFQGVNDNTGSVHEKMIISAFKEISGHLMDTIWVGYGEEFPSATLYCGAESENKLKVSHIPSEQINAFVFNICGEIIVVCYTLNSTGPVAGIKNFSYSVNSANNGNAFKIAAGLLMDYYAFAMGTRPSKDI